MTVATSIKTMHTVNYRGGNASDMLRRLTT